MQKLLLLVLVVMASACTSTSTESGSIDSDEPTSAATDGSDGSTSNTVADPDVNDRDTNEPGAEAVDAELVWTVVAVEEDDVLNVRGDPDARSPIVAKLDPWATPITVTDSVESTEKGVWRLIEVDGTTGWVNSRFLVAQPKELSANNAEAMIAASDELFAWLEEAGDTPVPGLSERSLWIGGTGVYADAPTPWTWVPAEELTTTADWNIARPFEFASGQACEECTRSLVKFLAVDRLDETTRSLVDDIEADQPTYFDGKLGMAPTSLHRVVLDTPSTNFIADDGTEQPSLDWQRLHVVFDWSNGEAAIHMLHVHGWTP